MDNQLLDPVAPEQKAVSVTDLITLCNNAARLMSIKNPNRWLLMNCGYALRQLVDRLANYEATIQ